MYRTGRKPHILQVEWDHVHQAAGAVGQAGVSRAERPSPSPLPHPLFLEPLGGGGCEGRSCPQAGHMPACLGLSLLQESTPPPREKALPFFPAPTLLAAWPTSLPLATPSACLSIIRSGADKRSPYEPGHEIPLWEIKAWGLGNSVGSGRQRKQDLGQRGRAKSSSEAPK